MKNSSPKWAINILLIYRYFMPFLTAICLFILSSLRPRPYFNGSFSADLIVRCVLWLGFTFLYWSLPTNLINIMRNKKNFFISVSKDCMSLISITFSAIVFGIFICLFTWWSLAAFIPQFHEAQNIIAFLNGLMYAAIVMLQYFLIPED
jgi:hypothetical protein